jgi:GntR family transcriptional regulator, vanillate catabolism transcriptional regulator
MRSTAAESNSVTDRITADLRDRIKLGQLVGGQRLIEADWTREFGVSRGPVREAFGRLVSEGLVTVEPNRGAVVKKLSVKDIVDIFETRAAIEGKAAALAAQGIAQRDHRTRLKALLKENSQYLRGGSFADYLNVNERFHDLVLDLADNETLRRFGHQLHAMAYHLQTTRVITLATSPSMALSVADSARFHRDIGAAILKGDADEAERLMRHHLDQTRDAILSTERR